MRSITERFSTVNIFIEYITRIDYDESVLDSNIVRVSQGACPVLYTGVTGKIT